jgi:hypothetical protein
VCVLLLQPCEKRKIDEKISNFAEDLSTTLSGPVLIYITLSEEHSIETSHADFYRNRVRNAENTNKLLFTP